MVPMWVKMVPMGVKFVSFWTQSETNVQKKCLPVGKKAKHIQEHVGAFFKIGGRSVLFFITWERKLHIYNKKSVRFWKLSGIPFCFSLQLESKINIYKNTSERFGNWRAFRFVFHYILRLILCAEYGPRGCSPAALEAVGGTPAHEAENRFWTTATPIVRTFGHGGGSAEGNWMNKSRIS